MFLLAIHDPDPRNNGKGIAMLKEAGIGITENILAEAVSEFLSPHLNRG